MIKSFRIVLIICKYLLGTAVVVALLIVGAVFFLLKYEADHPVVLEIPHNGKSRLSIEETMKLFGEHKKEFRAALHSQPYSTQKIGPFSCQIAQDMHRTTLFKIRRSCLYGFIYFPPTRDCLSGREPYTSTSDSGPDRAGLHYGDSLELHELSDGWYFYELKHDGIWH